MVKNNKNYENFNNIDFFNYYDKDYDKIVKIEEGYEIKKKDDVIIILTTNILKLKEIFSELNKIIPNYDKIFIMSILSLRLKINLIKDTWSFDENYIYNYIKKNKEENVSLKNFNNLKFLYMENKFSIYEFSNVNYKNDTIGNCMENTIFQFLKIIFFDFKNNKYDLNIVENIINEKNKIDIKYYIENIKLENTTFFNLEWFTYINNLKDDKNEPVLFYFVKNGYELDTNLQNFILFLKNVCKNDIYNEDNNIFLDNIIKKINKKYNIEIRKNENKINNHNIMISCDDNYVINLNTNHACFKNALTPIKDKDIFYNKINNNENITLQEYLNDNQYIFLSNIKLYISHYVLINNNLYEKLLSKIIKKEEINNFYISFFNYIIDNKIVISDNLNLIFIQNNWNYDLQKLLLIKYLNFNPDKFKEIRNLNKYDWVELIKDSYVNESNIKFSQNFINLNFFNYFNDNTWIFIEEKCNILQYWDLIFLGKKEDIIKNLSEEKWFDIFYDENFYNYFDFITDKKIYNLWNNKIWGDLLFTNRYFKNLKTDNYNNLIKNFIKKIEIYKNLKDDDLKSIINKTTEHKTIYSNILEWVYIMKFYSNTQLLQIDLEKNIYYIKIWNSYIWDLCITRNEIFFFSKLILFLKNKNSLEIENLWISIMNNYKKENKKLYDLINGHNYVFLKYLLKYINKSNNKNLWNNLISFISTINYWDNDDDLNLWKIYIENRNSFNKIDNIKNIDLKLFEIIKNNNDMTLNYEINLLLFEIIQNNLYGIEESKKKIFFKNDGLLNIIDFKNYLYEYYNPQNGGFNYNKYTKYLL